MTVSSSSSSSSSSTSFPVIDLIPKKETRAFDFVQAYPSYDGRNVRIGILDTGIFPSAHALHNMADGKTPKIVDLIDCSGSGDVQLHSAKATFVEGESKSSSADVSNDTSAKAGYWKVKGLSGRTLKLPTDWKFQKFPKQSKEKSKSSAKDETKKSDTAKESGTVEKKPSLDDSDDSDASLGSDKSDKSSKSTDDDTSKRSKKKKDKKKTVPVRLGIKQAYELFPKKLVARVKEQRKQQLQEKLNVHIADCRKELAELTGNGTKIENLTPEQVKTRDDIQARLDVLTGTNADDDPGPIYDCVVFYDGTNYRVMIDTDETGDFCALLQKQPESQPMTSFRHERQFGLLGTVDQMKYCVNFYDEGTVLSIVCDASPHGTHVAGITAAAASRPTGDIDKERSGVAPSAELVGLKIGDSRLGSMETGTALTRALIEARRLKCDIINLSYGEGCCLPNTGRFIRLAEELVWKDNIIFVSSAGNNGPALSTVGAPGGTTSAIIGVAAYVSPAMMKTEYSLPLKQGINVDGEEVQEGESETFEGSTYTWSSVGPTVDGDMGVNITAPGGAITSVSHWCLQKSMLMNGTSMSSPNATGCIALLISACKAEGINVSQPRIKRAIENTAKILPGMSPLQQGAGMIQVDRAFEYLKKFKDIDTEDLHFQVCVENVHMRPRGIYLRSEPECSLRQTFSVNVDPQFRREDVVSEETQRKRIEFEMNFRIVSTAPWIKVPDTFVVMNNGRSFKVDVNPCGLCPGLHTAYVYGVDANRPDRKVIFRVPVTVAKPQPTKRVVKMGEFMLDPAEVKRFFVTPPAGSTWMNISVRDCRDSESDGDSSSRLVVLHTVQLLPHAPYSHFEKQKYLTMMPSETSAVSVSVEEGVTVEVAVARYWSTIGTTKVEVDVEFRGIRPSPNKLQLLDGSGGSLVRLYADLQDEFMLPSAKLSSWRTPLRPKANSAVVPLGERDILPWQSKKIYELVLTYEFTQEEKGSFFPRMASLQGVLYESFYESQLMMIYDGEKKLLGVSDAFPSAVTALKGPVTIRLQVRHDEPSKLEKLKDSVLWIERKLDKDISLSVYPSKEDMMRGESGTCSRRFMRKGTCSPVFIATPSFPKLPVSCKAGDILHGSITYSTGDSTLPGSSKRPGGFPISYLVPPKPDKTPEPETPEAKDERSLDDKVDEAIRDAKVSLLGKLTKKEREDGKFDELYLKFVEEYPNHLPLLMAKLKFLDGEKRDTVLAEIASAAELIVSKIDQDELAMHFGRKSDGDDPSAVKIRKEMKEKKSILIEALARAARAYADMSSADAERQFDSTMKMLKEWVDIDSGDKFAGLLICRETKAGRYGSVLQILKKLAQNQNGKETKDSLWVYSKTELLDIEEQTYAKLGYSALADIQKRQRMISSPKSYALF